MVVINTSLFSNLYTQTDLGIVALMTVDVVENRILLLSAGRTLGGCGDAIPCIDDDTQCW